MKAAIIFLIVLLFNGLFAEYQLFAKLRPNTELLAFDIAKTATTNDLYSKMRQIFNVTQNTIIEISFADAALLPNGQCISDLGICAESVIDVEIRRSFLVFIDSGLVWEGEEENYVVERMEIDQNGRCYLRAINQSFQQFQNHMQRTNEGFQILYDEIQSVFLSEVGERMDEFLNPHQLKVKEWRAGETYRIPGWSTDYVIVFEIIPID